MGGNRSTKTSAKAGSIELEGNSTIGHKGKGKNKVVVSKGMSHLKSMATKSAKKVNEAEL